VDWFAPSNTSGDPQRYDFFANQLRVGAVIKIPHVKFTVQAQDTRLVNLPSDAGGLGPGALYFAHTRDRDQGETFLKLGNLVFSDIPNAPGLTATLGRFEYKDGLETVPEDAALAWVKKARISQRLLGPFGYTHVSRSFDGVQIAYENDRGNLTAMGTRPTQGGFEVSANPELDIWLAGIALTFKNLGRLASDGTATDVRAFYLYYRDDRDSTVKTDNRPSAIRGMDDDAVTVHTFGSHAIGVTDLGPGRLDGLLWGAVQAGDWGRIGHFAWAYAVEIGYQLPDLPLSPWLRGGFNRASGDDNPADLDHETFFQVMPTARIYARTPFFNMMNNQDLFAQLLLRPHQRVRLRLDYHYLRLTESADLWYAGGGATNGRIFGFAGSPSGGKHELGHLVDFSVGVDVCPGFSANAYYGRTFGESVVRSNFSGEDADYGYIELMFRWSS
jgi:hypothetical protein